MDASKLLELLEKTLKYTPIVYKQNSTPTNQDTVGTNFTLEYKHTSLPEDGLLFFLPVYSCKENASLTIKTPRVSNGATVYDATTYTIEVETNKGITRPTQANDIVAFRMCIFRFKKGSNSIVLINSPLYNDARFTNLTVTNASFLSKPTVYDPDDDIEYTLVSSKDLSAIERRLTKVENKVIYGNGDPEEALADRDVGTIYIKVEE